MLNQLTEEMKRAMKARDKPRLGVIRSVQAELKNAGIDKRGQQGLTQEVASPAELLEEDEMLAVLRGMVKKRKDAAEQYALGARQDLVDQELAEVVIIEEFLPQQLDEDQVRVLAAAAIAEVGASGMADMGKVMKIAQSRADGRADGKLLAGLVRELLA